MQLKLQGNQQHKQNTTKHKLVKNISKHQLISNQHCLQQQKYQYGEISIDYNIIYYV